MTASNPTYRFQPRPLHLLMAVVALQLIVALLTYSFTFTHEEAMWQYIGRNWFRYRLTPYYGGIDNKSPLIFAIYGFSDWLFGVNYWFPRVLGTAVEAIGMWYVFKIARQLAGNTAGIFAISLYGLSLCWKMIGGKMVSFTETYATTFIIISFYHCLTAAQHKNYFISGLLSGLGCCFRVSAVFGLLAVFISSFRRGVLAGLLFVAGVLLAGLLFLAFCWFTGIDVQDFLQYAIFDNFGTGSTTDHSLHWKLEQFMDNFFYSELVLFYPLIAGYFMLYRKIDAPAVWFIGTFIGINLLGIYADPHFKELLPAMCIMGALTLHQLTEKYKLSYTGLLAIVWFCFFPKVLEPWWGIKRLVNGSSITSQSFCEGTVASANDEAEKQLGWWIKKNTQPDDLVYVAGHGARVQAYSERRSPTAYFNVTQTTAAMFQIHFDLIQQEPALIAIPRFTDYRSYVTGDMRNVVDTLITQHYIFNRCLYGYAIYSRNVYSASSLPGRPSTAFQNNLPPP